MKRTLLFIACVMASIVIQAQEDSNGYRPLVEEGKHWTYDNFMPLRPAKYDHYYYYDLKGDTLIAGKKCLKMYSDNVYNDSIIHYEGALYEENKKVFCFFPGKEEAVLLYNFDCKIGDLLDIYYGDEQVLVTDIQSVALGDTIGRQYILQPVETFKYDGEMMYWIEGVGSTKDFFGMKPADGNNRYLDACELNGEYLYKKPVPDTTPKDYHKMGIEGKRWNYIHYYLDENGEHREPYSYVVRGDTVIRRTPYKKLWYQDGKTERLVCLLLEEGRGVYKSTDFGNNSYESPVFKTFFQFDRTDFGRVFTWKSKCQEGNTNWMVYGVDTIMVKNRQFRRYTCLQQYSDEGETLTTIPYDGKGVWRDIWVEGVGSASSGIEDQIPLHEPPLVTTSDYTYFVSCFEDGECIFTADDFNIQQDVNIAYRPLVEEGKVWHVFRSDAVYGSHLNHYMLLNEKIVKDGKTYMKMYRSEDDMTVVYDAGLFREEDRKVFIFDTDMQKEFLVFDYSLKAGDTYETYSYDEKKMVTYKVLSVSDYQEGPKVIYYNDGVSVERYLQKWTICRADNEYLQQTRIEGVGSLEGPMGILQDVKHPGLLKDYLAYVEYNDFHSYLPFSFYDTMNRLGCGFDLPIGEKSKDEIDWHNRLTYEMEGDSLHVYGKVLCNCGPNHYVYFYEKPTDDPSVHKIEFFIQEVEPLMDCKSLYATDFYVSGFDPNMNYIVVDNQGEEHPVVNKTTQKAYRPLVEDGKVWKVGGVGSNPVQLVEYCYFDGDTIIDGKTCKQMMCQRYVNAEHPDYAVISQYPMLRNVGAWYEEDKKVFIYDTNSKRFKKIYDFSVDANDTLLINSQRYVIGPRQTGGIDGFKGVYRDVWMLGGGYTIPNTTWLEGVGGIDGPTRNVYYGKEGHPLFLMSCAVGDEVIYLNDEYEDGATPDFIGARKGRFDFTHTIKIQPKAPRREPSSSQGEGSPLYGEYNELRLDINLDPLYDAYQVRITDESGKVVYEKDIKAADIVGLDIDISAYAKGRYTVSLENSSEIFTGEFEIQTTGIEEVRSRTIATGSCIYNLQGQRIGYLQKGLNIVNGQKVYVK